MWNQIHFVSSSCMVKGEKPKVLFPKADLYSNWINPFSLNPYSVKIEGFTRN